MTIQQTLSIIKPNAMLKNIIGIIIQRFENSGLILIGAKIIKLNFKQAENFYFEHKNKFFFNELIKFMISSPIFIFILEGELAIQKSREIIGNTNPYSALAGTLRSDYSDSITKNTIHSSDSIDSAKREISYFFLKHEIYSNYL